MSPTPSEVMAACTLVGRPAPGPKGRTTRSRLVSCVSGPLTVTTKSNVTLLGVSSGSPAWQVTVVSPSGNVEPDVSAVGAAELQTTAGRASVPSLADGVVNVAVAHHGGWSHQR